MEPYTFRIASLRDKEAIIEFMNTHWGSEHPLVNLPDYFAYYYTDGADKNKLHFALAEQEGKLAAIAGYIPANSRPVQDIWVSLWVADKKAMGSGLDLMAALPQITGCNTIACNNIRPETRPFYDFLGYKTDRMGHFYRLAPKGNIADYKVARLQTAEIYPVDGEGELTLLPDAKALVSSGFIPPEKHNPYKDLAYIQKRYYEFPRQKYMVYAGALPGEPIAALLVARKIPVLGTNVLRIVDCIGDAAFLPQLGRAIENLLVEAEAEYADFYSAGLAPEILTKAGFTQRVEGDSNILPNYLDPPLFENTDYYYFTNNPIGFTMFKADGDQDRPNLG